jgi:cell fate (sporulation/competence/biofilm development) regulator YlbF (YheA/YmcA/DUF963 family)
MNVNESSIALAEAIKTTAEYSKLKQARSVIWGKPNLKKEIEEYNLSQKQLYNNRAPSKEIESKVQQLKTKYDNLLKNPEVDSYIKALNGFNELISKVYKNINQHLDNGLK